MNLYRPFKDLMFCILIAIFFGCNSKSNTQNNRVVYNKDIDSLMIASHQRGLFNGNILVAKNDTIIYQKGFGFRDYNQNKRLDNNSIHNIGSIAKQFNAVSIMILQERGMLNIHDTISEFDLGLPNWSKKVTISHLLNYTSGVPKIDIRDYPKNDEEAWEILRRVDTLRFEPGTDFDYENSNVFLQKRIIEKVTGKSYSKFVTENIINPLKMTNTVFDPEFGYPKRTSCFGSNKRNCPEFEFVSGWPWMNANDLYKWITAMNSNLLITQESFNTLLVNPYVNDKGSSLGQYFKEEQLQQHDGTAINFKSILLNDLKNDFVIILLTNTPGEHFEISYEIRNILLGIGFNVPKKSIRRALQKDFIAGVDQGIKAYHKLKQSDNLGMYNFKSPIELNRLCLDAYRQGITIEESIKVFKFAVSEFPNDTILLGNLGEMYFENKAYDLALENFKKVLTIDADNSKAKKKIEEISILKSKAN